MVDINLIGDDKTGEEERVEDFTQTSSMDTQELAFEERTETFDTTKTAGFDRKRSYSSLITTSIIVVVVALLAWSIYFFILNDDGSDQGDLLTLTEAQNLEELPPEETSDLEEFDLGNGQEDLDQQPFQEEITTPPVVRQQPTQEIIRQAEPVTRPPVKDTTPPVTTSSQASLPRVNLTAAPVSMNTQEAVQAVTGLMNSVPANLSTTLLSYGGQHVRFEFVAGSSAAAQNFISGLNQYMSDYSVVSEGPVASNGSSVEKVLIAGTISNSGSTSGNGVAVLSLSEAKDWFTSTCRDFGLVLRQITSQPSIFVGNYEKTPMLLRVYGAQSSIISFLQELSSENMNVELSKILLVSPDLVSYSDDNLVLVLNLFLYQPS